MDRNTQDVEAEAVEALLLLGEVLHPELSENLLKAIGGQLVQLESAQAERRHLNLSIKAGRRLLEGASVQDLVLVG